VRRADLASLQDGLPLDGIRSCPVTESERVGGANGQQLRDVGTSQHQESRRYRPLLAARNKLPPLRTRHIGDFNHFAIGLYLVTLRTSDGRAVEKHQDVIS